MVNQIIKYLRRKNREERWKIINAIDYVQNDKSEQVNFKKLKGSSDIYRAKCGKTRIFFRKIDGKYVLIGLRNRDDQTYRNL